MGLCLEKIEALMKKNLFLVLTAVWTSGAFSTDLGIQGKVWPIIERDIREDLVLSASEVDWEKKQKELTENAKGYLDRLPKRNFPLAQENKIVYIDPSIVLTSDIQAPVEQADGSFKWEVMAKKGTRVNPLHTNKPVTAFLFFDGSDPDQIKLLKEILNLNSYQVVFVEAGSGSVKLTSDLLERPIFHANDALISKFSIQALPSLVFPGDEDYSDYIAVKQLAKPLVAEYVLNSWSTTRLSPLKKE